MKVTCVRPGAAPREAPGLGRRDHPRAGRLVKTFHGDEWRGRDFTGQTRRRDRRGRRGGADRAVGRSHGALGEGLPGGARLGVPLPVPVVRGVAARLHLRLSVKDPWTRRLLTPGRFGPPGRRRSAARYYGAPTAELQARRLAGLRASSSTACAPPKASSTASTCSSSPRHRPRRNVRCMSTPDHEVAIIGGGFSGIGAAILLDKAGFADYLMIEEGDGVGGAWHWNTYPGVGGRHPVVQLPVLVRADRRLVAGLRAGAASSRRTPSTASTSTTSAGAPGSTPGVVGATFDDEAHLWRLGHVADGDIDHRPLRRRRHRRAHPAQGSRTIAGPRRTSPAP